MAVYFPFRSFLCLFINILLFTHQVESGKVLLSGCFGVGSHYFTAVAIGESLVKRGHNVTILIADEYPDENPDHINMFEFETFHYPGLKAKMEYIFDQVESATFNPSSMSQVGSAVGMVELFNAVNHDTCRSLFDDEALVDRLANFDAFVVDIVWPCGVYLKSYLARHNGAKDIHAMVLAPMTPNSYVFQEAGSPFIPSYQPVLFSRLTSSMTFFQRFTNTFLYLSLFFLLNKKTQTNVYYDFIDEYDLDPRLKYRIGDHVDLYLINVDFSVEFPFSLMPNVIPVGGLTTRPANPLNDELEDFMQASGDDGVVLFSLGTYFASITRNRPDIVKVFIDAFSRIPQRVLLHLKDLPTYEIPGNIKARSWLPLNDLLGHPKTRAIFYHGGNNGFLEALYHGVPLVVMPLGGDQHDVAARIVANGLGVQIDKDQLSSDYIYKHLKEVLDNAKYSATAKRLSAVFRDRPMTAADTAAFWIEHVIKHGGEHLRPPTQGMPFFQIYLLDIVVFTCLVVVSGLLVTYSLIKRCCCSKPATKSKKD